MESAWQCRGAHPCLNSPLRRECFPGSAANAHEIGHRIARQIPTQRLLQPNGGSSQGGRPAETARGAQPVQAPGQDAQLRRRVLQLALEDFEFLREQAAQRAHGFVVTTDRSECARVIEYRQRGW